MLFRIVLRIFLCMFRWNSIGGAYAYFENNHKRGGAFVRKRNNGRLASFVTD